MKWSSKDLAGSEADGLSGELKQWLDKFTDDFHFLGDFFAARTTNYCVT